MLLEKMVFLPGKAKPWKYEMKYIDEEPDTWDSGSHRSSLLTQRSEWNL